MQLADYYMDKTVISAFKQVLTYYFGKKGNPVTTQVYYLSYVSTISLRALVKSSTVKDIINVAQNFNKTQSITGFLCYGSRCFFQFIEGTKEAIESLFAQLKKDPRHHKVTVISEGFAEQRRFTQWDMYSVTFDEFITENNMAHSFMPFRPYDWDARRSHDFVDLFDSYYGKLIKTPKLPESALPIVYNPLGKQLKRLFAEHQIFIFLQVILLIASIGTSLAMGLFSWRK